MCLFSEHFWQTELNTASSGDSSKSIESERNTKAANWPENVRKTRLSKL